MTDEHDIDLASLAWKSMRPGSDPLRMAVIADSTSFTDHRGPQMPSDPGLYPNVAATILGEALGRDVVPVVVAEPGMTVRTAHRAVTKDRHVMFDVLLDADMVVVGIGGFDHAPAGVPAAVDAVLPFLRPPALRRRARSAARAAYPWLVRGTGFRFQRIPTDEFVRLFDQMLVHVRGLSKGAPGVVVGPTSHDNSAYYGGRHPRFRASEARQLATAREHGYATLSAWDIAEPYTGGRLDEPFNVDGIHWPRAVHEQVGQRVAAALLPQLTGEADPPGLPVFAAEPSEQDS